MDVDRENARMRKGSYYQVGAIALIFLSRTMFRDPILNAHIIIFDKKGPKRRGHAFLVQICHT